MLILFIDCYRSLQFGIFMTLYIYLFIEKKYIFLLYNTIICLFLILNVCGAMYREGVLILMDYSCYATLFYIYLSICPFVFSLICLFIFCFFFFEYLWRDISRRCTDYRGLLLLCYTIVCF